MFHSEETAVYGYCWFKVYPWVSVIYPQDTSYLFYHSFKQYNLHVTQQEILSWGEHGSSGLVSTCRDVYSTL